MTKRKLLIDHGMSGTRIGMSILLISVLRACSQCLFEMCVLWIQSLSDEFHMSYCCRT